jgi:hypothetical protein
MESAQWSKPKSTRTSVCTSQTTTWQEFPKLWGPWLEQVYEFVRPRRELATGDGEELWQNVMLYKDQRPSVEVGVLVSGPFQVRLTSPLREPLKLRATNTALQATMGPTGPHLVLRPAVSAPPG